MGSIGVVTVARVDLQVARALEVGHMHPLARVPDRDRQVAGSHRTTGLTPLASHPSRRGGFVHGGLLG